jgi:hypothetical protein
LPPLFPLLFGATAGPPAPIPTAIVPPTGIVVISNHLSISCPAPPPPEAPNDQLLPAPPAPPPATIINLITGPEFAGLVQLPDE